MPQTDVDANQNSAATSSWPGSWTSTRNFSIAWHIACCVMRKMPRTQCRTPLLKLHKSESCRAMQNERAYLARVVWRAALDRRSSRAASVEEDADLRVVDTRPTPEYAAAEADQRLLLQELIHRLPDTLKQPLLLSAMEEMSSREIGEIMGLPEGHRAYSLDACAP